MRSLKRNSVTNAFSLIEVLLTLLLLSATLLPVILLLQDHSLNNKRLRVQSIRNLVLMKITENIDLENPNFTSDYTDSAMQSVTESGTPVIYLRKVDAANSNDFTRQLYVYLYRNLSDPLTSPLMRARQTYLLDELRVDVGQTSQGFHDSSNQIWTQDTAYNNGNKVPGWVSVGTAGSNTGVAITNTVNDTLYHTYRQGATVSYSFDVPNGDYTLQLYFAELDGTINGSGNRRLADISVEGATVLSSYSPFESTAVTGKADIRSFNVTVSDGVLNLIMTRSAASNQDPRLAAISVTPHV